MHRKRNRTREEKMCAFGKKSDGSALLRSARIRTQTFINKTNAKNCYADNDAGHCSGSCKVFGLKPVEENQHGTGDHQQNT